MPQGDDKPPPVPDELLRPVARPSLPGAARNGPLADPAGLASVTGSEQTDRQLAKAISLSGLGMEFVSTIVVAGLIGYAVDLLCGTFPSFAIGLVVIGIVAGLVRLVRSGLRMSR